MSKQSIINSNIHLLKEELTEDQEQALNNEFKKTLGVKNPEWIKNARFARWQGWRNTISEYIYYFRENSREFILPRNYPISIPDIDLYDKKSFGKKTSYSFYPKLREYQENYFKQYPELLETDDKVINAACGSGKTLLGIYLSWKFRVRTIILVPTHYLASQWAEKITEYTNATYHVWKATDKEIPKGMDFYIISFDLFTLREMPEWFVNSIGHAILDEAHRTAATTYLPILNMLPAKRRTALTATFRRDDGGHRILAYHFGVVYKMEYDQPTPLVYPVNLQNKVHAVLPKKGKWELLKNYIEEEFEEKVTETKNHIEFINHYKYRKKLSEKKYSLTKTNALRNILNRADKQSYPVVYSYLTEQNSRRRKILTIIEECMQAGRTVLFLSSRKESLKRFYKVFEEYKPVIVISKSTENMTEEQKEYMLKKCRLIFGIYQLAKEGLDVPRIDTIIFDTPIKDTEQPIGRSTRLVEGKKESLILYLWDENSLCNGVFNAARRFININAVLKEFILWDKVKTIL